MGAASTSANAWLPSTGSPPRPSADDAASLDRVGVRLRNGMEPAESWPVFATRGPSTRWSLTDHPFDITHWRPA